MGDFAQADRYYRESFNVNQSTGIREINATLLEGFGRIACARGEPARAVRLWSAAAEERKAIGLLFHPADRATLDNDVQAARTRFGDQAYEAAWLEGAVRPLDELL